MCLSAICPLHVVICWVSRACAPRWDNEQAPWAQRRRHRRRQRGQRHCRRVSGGVRLRARLCAAVVSNRTADPAERVQRHAQRPAFVVARRALRPNCNSAHPRLQFHPLATAIPPLATAIPPLATAIPSLATAISPPLDYNSATSRLQFRPLRGLLVLCAGWSFSSTSQPVATPSPPRRLRGQSFVCLRPRQSK